MSKYSSIPMIWELIFRPGLVYFSAFSALRRGAPDVFESWLATLDAVHQVQKSYLTALSNWEKNLKYTVNKHFGLIIPQVTWWIVWLNWRFWGAAGREFSSQISKRVCGRSDARGDSDRKRHIGLLHIGQTLRISNHFRRHLWKTETEMDI